VKKRKEKKNTDISGEDEEKYKEGRSRSVKQKET
jgi:hypothetical protein